MHGEVLVSNNSKSPAPKNGLRLIHSQTEEQASAAKKGPKSAFAREMTLFADQLDAYVYSVLSQ